MVASKHVGAGALLFSLMVATPACLFPNFGADGDGTPELGSARDGEACIESNECASHYCASGYCDGSDCSDGGNDACEEGWKCVHYEPDAFSSFFGSDPSDDCTPTCGHCPPTFHCDPGNPTGACPYGPEPPVVEAGGPYSAVSGQPVSLTGTASSPNATITTYAWTLDDTSEPVSGASIEHVFTTPGTHYASITVTDSRGTTATAQTTVDVCAALGTACNYYDASCCEGTTCNADGLCE